jgi:hypothetical protein
MRGLERDVKLVKRASGYRTGTLSIPSRTCSSAKRLAGGEVERMR